MTSEKGEGGERGEIAESAFKTYTKIGKGKKEKNPPARKEKK